MDELLLKPSVCYSSTCTKRPSATCQRLRRRQESVASACCSSVVSEAALVFYYRERQKNAFSIISGPAGLTRNGHVRMSMNKRENACVDHKVAADVT